MIGKIFGGAAVVALGLLSGPIPAAEAHHSISAQYDLGKKATIKGVLTKVDWQNPHAWFHFDAKQADGSVKAWTTETMAPSGLRRLGFNDQSAFVVGATYSLDVFPDRSGSPMGFIRSVTFPDGKEVVFRNANAGGTDLEPVQDTPLAAAPAVSAKAAAPAPAPAPVPVPASRSATIFDQDYFKVKSADN